MIEQAPSTCTIHVLVLFKDHTHSGATLMEGVQYTYTHDFFHHPGFFIDVELHRDLSASASTTTGTSTAAPTAANSSGSASLDVINTTSISMNYTLAKASDAESTIASTYRSWVGARSVSADSTCYREAHIMDVSKNLWQITKGVKTAVDCANSMIGTVRTIIRYVRNIKTSNPQSFAGQNLGAVILLNVIACDDEIVSSWEKFKVFLTAANFTETANEINDTEIATLSDALKSNSTCGFDLKSLADRTWMTVAQFRADNPDITEDEPRLKMEDSQLVTYGIGIATNNCMEQVIQESDEATAYTTRDTIRKAFSGMINDLISTGKSDNGSSETAKEFTHKAFDKAFTSIAVTGFDLTGISGLLAEYLQTICDPTRFIDAFNDSSSSWTRMGDGQVIINISSFDTKNVTVNIISGGDKIDEVTVAAGGTATWVSNNTALGGKTLYLDRWRPGLFGIPGTRGGSLLLWAPKASQVGHLEIQAKLNPFVDLRTTTSKLSTPHCSTAPVARFMLSSLGHSQPNSPNALGWTRVVCMPTTHFMDTFTAAIQFGLTTSSSASCRFSNCGLAIGGVASNAVSVTTSTTIEALASKPSAQMAR
ncbi:hypothetical protein ON010_g3382 [Phytophthora cinnamomi]|nr:hypothetical protein ON010_g3382 [Phytophthora cinnamomi]